MSKQQDIKYKIITINVGDMTYTGDINKIVRENFNNGDKYGIITDSYDKYYIQKTIFYLKKLISIKWVYISKPNNKILIFSDEIKRLNSFFDKERFLKIISNIWNFEFNEVYIYPIENILLTFKPKYSKDSARKIEWNYGKLGKKEIRRKYERMRRQILYDV